MAGSEVNMEQRARKRERNRERERGERQTDTQTETGRNVEMGDRYKRGEQRESKGQRNGKISVSER